jgi:hypothetical protein
MLNKFYIYIYIYFMKHKNSSQNKLAFHCTWHSASPFFCQSDDQLLTFLSWKHAYMYVTPVLGFLPVKCLLTLVN